MNLREVIKLLCIPRETILTAITHGVRLPKSQQKIKLHAAPMGVSWDVALDDLERFVSAFEEQEPGRHPPIKVLRQLRSESRYCCGICREERYLQYHHIIPWEELKHHDVERMIAVCYNCHKKIHMGDIGRQDVESEKNNLQKNQLNRESVSDIFSRRHARTKKRGH